MNAHHRTELRRLLVLAADGDRRALAPLFAVAWPAVRAFCGHIAPGPDAEDAAQEAMIRVYAQVPSYDPERDGLTWILAIAAWQCRTVRRRQERRREAPPEDGARIATPAARPDQLAERRELLAAAAEVLGTLSPTDASTLVAAWTDDDAARAALAPATFRKRLGRALGRFRSSWRSRHDVP